MSGNLRAVLNDARNAKDETQAIEPEVSQVVGAGEITLVKHGVGRPASGKRSNPDYERLNLLIRKATRRQVDMRMLLQPELAKDLSVLVDQLLTEWVQKGHASVNTDA